MTIWIGFLFLIAWAIGMETVKNVGPYIHLLLLIGGGAVGWGILLRPKEQL